jgi:hypothetical protein
MDIDIASIRVLGPFKFPLYMINMSYLENRAQLQTTSTSASSEGLVETVDGEKP